MPSAKSEVVGHCAAFRQMRPEAEQDISSKKSFANPALDLLSETEGSADLLKLMKANKDAGESFARPESITLIWANRSKA
jgi:hypothetical protein